MSVTAAIISSPGFPGEGDQRSWWRGLAPLEEGPSTIESSFNGPPPLQLQGRRA